MRRMQFVRNNQQKERTWFKHADFQQYRFILEEGERGWRGEGEGGINCMGKKKIRCDIEKNKTCLNLRRRNKESDERNVPTDSLRVD